MTCLPPSTSASADPLLDLSVVEVLGKRELGEERSAAGGCADVDGVKEGLLRRRQVSALLRAFVATEELRGKMVDLIDADSGGDAPSPVERGDRDRRRRALASQSAQREP
jgi:hypothetical protein